MSKYITHQSTLLPRIKVTKYYARHFNRDKLTKLRMKYTYDVNMRFTVVEIIIKIH